MKPTRTICNAAQCRRGVLDHSSTRQSPGSADGQAPASRNPASSRRALAALLGIKGAEFRENARLSYAKVAEYQRRGLVHFHAVLRLDGPDGPHDRPPSGLDLAALRTAITDAAKASALTVERPDGAALRIGWGPQLDLREVTATARAQIEDEDGEITDAALAGYIAKYATQGADRPIRDIAHVEYLRISDHHRHMITTAWELGGLVSVPPVGRPFPG